jgi:hypothetical protein
LQRTIIASGIAVVALLRLSAALPAQKTHFIVQPATSLAWWQMNPHLNHLWATSCPADKDWRPGDGVGLSLAQGLVKQRSKRVGSGNVLDTVVPLYPRKVVADNCVEAVRGEIAVDDLKTLRGARGKIIIELAQLSLGKPMYDKYERSILQTDAFPTAEFKIDSMTLVQPGDTTHATAFGVFELHGVARPVAIPVRAWKDPAGIRVQGKFSIPAFDLIEVYGFSKYKLGLGVTNLIWKYLSMGIDVIMKPTATG